MEDRNKFLEQDGLYWESETHEWFNDRSSTLYANNSKTIKLNFYCFVVRDKSNGEYDRVVLDGTDNKPIYSTKSLDDLIGFLDKMKIIKKFEKDEKIQ